MSKAMMAFGAFTTALSVGLTWELVAPVAGVMVGFGTLVAVVVDETS